MPTWAEVYPRITGYPAVLQALLAPAPTPKEYYQCLMAAAREVGLTDSQMLLGLLWHAPLGDSSHLPQRRKYFQRLVSQSLTEEPEGFLSERPQSQARSLPPPPPAAGDDDLASEESFFPGAPGVEMPAGAGFPSPSAASPAPSTGARPRRQENHGFNGNGRSRNQEEGEELYEPWAELFRLSRDNLVVDRRRYEAMIYELGKLGAWQDIFKNQRRENRQLRDKIEAQWAKELEFFRNLSSRREKKGWRR